MIMTPVVTLTKENHSNHGEGHRGPTLVEQHREGEHSMDITMLAPSKRLADMRHGITKSRQPLFELQQPQQYQDQQQSHQEPQQQQQQQHHYQQLQGRKQAPPQTTGMSVGTQDTWRTTMQRVKILYAKGQYQQCAALCKQLLDEKEGNPTAVSPCKFNVLPT